MTASIQTLTSRHELLVVSEVRFERTGQSGIVLPVRLDARLAIGERPARLFLKRAGNRHSRIRHS